MHSCRLRFKMLGLLSSGFPGNTIGWSSGKLHVGCLMGFRLEEEAVIPGGVPERTVSLLNRIFFISLSLAKLHGDPLNF